jgi:hypothetical protein
MAAMVRHLLLPMLYSTLAIMAIIIIERLNMTAGQVASQSQAPTSCINMQQSQDLQNIE